MGVGRRRDHRGRGGRHRPARSRERPPARGACGVRLQRSDRGRSARMADTGRGSARPRARRSCRPKSPPSCGLPAADPGRAGGARVARSAGRAPAGARRLPHRPGAAHRRGPAGRPRPRRRADQAGGRTVAPGHRVARRGGDAAVVRPPRPVCRTRPATRARRRDRGVDRAGPGGLPGRLRAGRRGAPARARDREGDLRVHLRRRVRARLDVCARGRDALADGGAMADLHPELFAADVREAVRVLSEPPADLEPLEPLARRARRVLFLGMGSSRFAALDAATLLRSHGVEATAEMASTGLPQPPTADTLVLAISASGGSAETVTALRRHVGTSMVVGLTARPDSPIATGGRPLPADRGRRPKRRGLRQLSEHRGAAPAGVRPARPGAAGPTRERAAEAAAAVLAAAAPSGCRRRSSCSPRGRSTCWRRPSGSGAPSSRRSCCARCPGCPRTPARRATGHTWTST